VGVWSGITGALDHAAGSTDEAIGRQFDDTEGGGFADEFGAVVDPTQGASGQTERDVRTVASVLSTGGVQSGQTYLGVSDAVNFADVMGGTTPSIVDRVPDETTPEGDGNLFSGDPAATLTNTWDAVTPDLPGWVPIAAVVVGVLLAVTALGQLFTVEV
jgi:hypothetical protein